MKFSIYRSKNWGEYLQADLTWDDKPYPFYIAVAGALEMHLNLVGIPVELIPITDPSEF